MEATYRTKAIILDRQVCAEVDSRVIAYSFDKGKLELVARGTAKLSSKLAGHLEPFNLVDLMVINGRGPSYAGAADSLAAATSLKNDWDKISAGGYLLALYKKLLKPGESDKKVFLLLAQFIYWLNAIEASALYYQLIARLAAWKLLNLLGLADVAMLGGSSPQNIREHLAKFGRADFVANLKTLKLTATEARQLIKYLERLIIEITE
jgi:DNA repair protein RecO (recombination protein O)